MAFSKLFIEESLDNFWLVSKVCKPWRRRNFQTYIDYDNLPEMFMVIFKNRKAKVTKYLISISNTRINRLWMAVLGTLKIELL